MSLIAVFAMGGLIHAQDICTVSDSLGFDSAVSTHPTDIIAGKVAGVRVSSSAESPLGAIDVEIRGMNTLHGNNQPLYVVDGAVMKAPLDRVVMPFWNYAGFSAAETLNSMGDICAYDIESIQVLKDGAATALYGSNGANGVVIIRTKHSNFREREIDIHSNVGFVGLTKPGFTHNHHLLFAGSKNNSSFKMSASFSDSGSKSLARSLDRATINLAYEKMSVKGIQFGTNVVAGLGAFDNSGIHVLDFEDNGKRYSAIGSVWMKVDFTKYLSWKTDAGLDFRSFNRYFWYGNGNQIGRQYNGLASIVNHSAISGNVESVLAFNRYFAQAHHLRLEAGVEYIAGKGRYNTTSGNDFFSHELRAKGLSSMNCARYIHNYDMYFKQFAFGGRASYDYSGWCGADVAVRWDRTMYDDKFVLYPSASAWVDLKKTLLKDSECMSSLRLEGGWGKSAKYDDLSYDEINITHSREWTVGGSIGMFDNRLAFSLKYYDRNSRDNYVSTVSNNGYELVVSAVPVTTGNLRWSINICAAYNANQLLSLDYSYLNGRLPGTANIVGNSLSSIVGYDVTPDGYFIDRTRDGHITEADRIVLAPSMPDFFGGISTNFKYRNFVLDILADYQAGAYMIDWDKMHQERQSRVTARYIKKADEFRLAHAGVKYEIPVNLRWMQNIGLSLSWHDLRYSYAMLLGINLQF